MFWARRSKPPFVNLLTSKRQSRRSTEEIDIMIRIHTIAALVLAAGFAAPAAAADQEWDFFMYPYKRQAAGPTAAAPTDHAQSQDESPSAEGAFMTIHLDNQKIGSAVFAFWDARATDGIAASGDGYMAIHLNNQKVGSEVWQYWHNLVSPDPVVQACGSK